MSELTLTKTAFEGGVWTGVLTGVPSGQSTPVLQVLLRGEVITTAQTSEGDGRHEIRIDLPASVMGEGVQSLLIVPAGETTPLATIRLVAGAPLEQDLQAEINDLRAELDLLKSAFRRHCADTA
ncbi:hypothetical protein [Actibacterium pelagium]|uniref:Uncharacterized protein n=1 Tax=Actibacterium pelagium TaxID=2029103 RepID=A0A917EKA9_9RHOB|nr:hypothetical protein [Actibacterium pelagium]GGE52705.1 hypothetical protein GCM10011517_20600 [Actibacterium pelagium]